MTGELDGSSRLEFAKALAREAGTKALGYFHSIGDLDIQSKGVQDMVSNADLEVETFIRTRIGEAFPDDGIVGEEHGRVESRSGYTWVIDPIDGTANFVAAIPQWCIILAVVHDDAVKVAAVYEPCQDELFWAGAGQGSYVNDVPAKVSQSPALNVGNTGIGMNGRSPKSNVVALVGELANRGGLFFRNASGGLMLAYVAAGRLIAYAEPHMNPWDCLAGQLLIAEAGGRIEKQSADAILKEGGRVIAAGPHIFDELVAIADEAFCG